MTTPRKTDEQAQLSMIVGQLLEATKAASEGLKGLSLEMRGNSSAVIAAVTTLTAVEKTVQDLDRVVRSGSVDSVLMRLQIVVGKVEDLEQADTEVAVRLDNVETRVDVLETVRTQAWAGGKVTFWLIGVAAWLITTGIAVWGALKGK